VNEAPEDKEMTELYRKWLGRELARPEIKAAKQEFLSAHFSEQPVPVFGAAFMVPVMALAALFLYFNFLSPLPSPQPPPLNHRTDPTRFLADSPTSGRGSDGESISSPFQGEDGRSPGEGAQLTDAERPAVEVKRLTSRTGSTMVYQKMVNDVPVTIIWVFNAGSKI